MTLADVAAEGELFIDAGGGEPANAHGPFPMAPDGIEIAEEVILSADGNGGPVSVGVLLGLVNFVFHDGTPLAFFHAVLGDVLGNDLGGEFVFSFAAVPMRVKIFGELSGGFGSFIDGGSEDFEVTFSVLTHGMHGEGRVPGVVGGVDGAPVF